MLWSLAGSDSFGRRFDGVSALPVGDICENFETETYGLASNNWRIITAIAPRLKVDWLVGRKSLEGWQAQWRTRG